MGSYKDGFPPKLQLEFFRFLLGKITLFSKEIPPGSPRKSRITFGYGRRYPIKQKNLNWNLHGHKTDFDLQSANPIQKKISKDLRISSHTQKKAKLV